MISRATRPSVAVTPQPDTGGARRCAIVASIAAMERDLAPSDLAQAAWLELRADLVGDVAGARLRRASRQRLVYALRSREQGGSFDAGDDTRRARLRRAIRDYDLIELEIDRDTCPELLASIPKEKRLVSWYGPAAGPGELDRQFDRMSVVPAAHYKLVCHASTPVDGIAPLALLRERRRSDLIAYASGAAGAWTRILAPHFGSPFVFASAGRSASTDDPGAMSLSQLEGHYDLPCVPRISTLFAILGGAVLQSLAPCLHNAGYRALGEPALYVPLVSSSEDMPWLASFAGGLRDRLGLDLGGITVTAPHKDAAVIAAGEERCSRGAWATRSANNIVPRGHAWHAETDGVESVLGPVRTRGIRVEGRRVAVLGCGGAGRAAALGLAEAGARVTLFNRCPERGARASALLGLPSAPLADFDAGGFEVVVNATPVGKHGEEMPFPAEALRPDAALVDLVYRRNNATALVAHAREMGCVVIDGREILAASVTRQFELLTGRGLPGAVLDAALSGALRSA